MEKSKVHVFKSALLAAVLYLLASPAVFCWEVNLWPLVFFVPAIWSSLVRSETFAESRLRYTKIYLSSLLFWLVSTFWVCFPHPLTSLGWIALSAYLACYLPIFIAVSRRLTRLYRLPTYLVCPVVWVCVEWFRNHVFGGMSLAALEHSLYKVPILIQCADLGGQYLVAAQIVFLGCCLERIVIKETKEIKEIKEPGTERSEVPGLNPASGPASRPASYPGIALRFIPGSFGLCMLIFMLVYGGCRFVQILSLFNILYPEKSPVRIAVTQGNYPVMLDPPDDQWKKTFDQYCKLSEAAVKQAKAEGKPLDLIVWPETVFPYSMPDEEFVTDQEELAEALETNRAGALEMASHWNTPLLLGAPTVSFKPGREDRLNSAVLVDPFAQTVGPRYDKVHLVMFGEYVPFAEYLPDDFPLKTLCQTAGRGTKPVAIPIPRTEMYLSPNICFEGLVPHLVRKQIVELKRQGKEPDILVNLSNVGWFYFTSQIDLQFAAQVFRAVENRKPYITAANGGFSAYIASNGVIGNQGKRKEAVSFICDVMPGHRQSLYTAYGDLFAYGCLTLTMILLILKRR